jgi:anti-anti-sigma regulatory factor
MSLSLLITTKEEAERLVVSFPPQTELGESNADELERILVGLLPKCPKGNLAVDLGNVSLLTSVILTKFIVMNTRLRAKQSKFTLLNPTLGVAQALKVTRLDQVLEVR